MRGFPGFPDGKLRVTPLPEPFFSDLLPLIDDLDELKVTLYCFWLLHRKQGETRHVTAGELEADHLLVRSVGTADALHDGLERAVARGTLLQVTAQRPGRSPEAWYYLNSGRGRQAVARIERGESVPEDDDSGPIHLRAQRPNIYVLYEQNIGLLQPLLAEELEEAEELYPPEWIEEAFRIAAASNARNWAYVRAILERWAREGRTGRGRGERRRDTGGEYDDVVER
jgi:DnaD/phage-associated family protein